MKEKFLFFDIKRNYIINIIIVLQVALCIFYLSSLLSIINFEKNYKNRFYNSIPIENTQKVMFYDMMIKSDGMDDTIEKNKNVISEVLKYLDSVKYPYGIFRAEKEKRIAIDGIDLKEKADKVNFSQIDKDENRQQFYFNKGMINEYLKNINGNVELDKWNYNNEYIPVVMGSNFKEDLGIGQTFDSNDKTYKVIGFFNKGTIAFDLKSAITGSFILDSSIIMPIRTEDFVNTFEYNPILLYSSNKSEEEKEQVIENIKKIRSDVHIEPMDEELNNFLTMIFSTKTYEMVRVGAIVTLAIASLIAIITFKLLNDRSRIGVLYSLGISKNKIFSIFIEEIISYLIIGIILGTLLYMKKGGRVFAFFMNEYIVFNVTLSITIIMVIMAIIIALGMRKVGKLTPKEMIGGFVE